MRARFLTALLIGVLIPGAALRYPGPPSENDEPVQVAATTGPLPTTTVVVASRDLSPRELLRAEALQEVAWPVAALPAGAFTTIGDLLGDGSAKRRARHEILPGEPVLRSKIFGLSGRDTPGRTRLPHQRVRSVRVSASHGIAGVLLLGDARRLAIALPIGEPMPAAQGGGALEPAAAEPPVLEAHGLLERPLRGGARRPACAGPTAHPAA